MARRSAPDSAGPRPGAPTPLGKFHGAPYVDRPLTWFYPEEADSIEGPAERGEAIKLGRARRSVRDTAARSTPPPMVRGIEHE